MLGKALLLTAFVVAPLANRCEAQALTRDNAARLITQSNRLDRDSLLVVVGEGCVSLLLKDTDAGNFFGNWQNQGPQGALIQTAMTYGILDATAEVWMVESSRPPAFCRQQWDSWQERRTNRLAIVNGHGYGVVHWRTELSAQARAAGIMHDGWLRLGGEQVVRITGIIQAPQLPETGAEFECQWVPSPMIAKLGVHTLKPESGEASFLKYDDGWRLREVRCGREPQWLEGLSLTKKTRVLQSGGGDSPPSDSAHPGATRAAGAPGAARGGVNQTPLDSLVNGLPSNKEFDAVTQDYPSPVVPVWLAIQAALKDQKDGITSSDNKSMVIVADGMHGGLFKRLDRYYIWMEAVSPTQTRLHVQLMRFNLDVNTSSYTHPETRDRTSKAAKDFLANVGKAIKP